MRGVAAALVALLVAGPAAAAVKPVLEPPVAVEPIAESEILAMSPEMARFLARKVKPGLVRRARLERLIHLIFSKRGLDISYGNTTTRTAAETFAARNGNCLSFTLMFVAMARHLGLDAYFKEVDEVTSWDRRGEVVVTERHMFAEVELDNALRQVDFLPDEERSYRNARRVDTPRVYAHFYSNRGVELLTAGRARESLVLFERALVNDPSFVQALVNLGVAERKLGRPARAEEAFRLALETDRNDRSAAANLAALYLSQGRETEAAPLLARVEDHLRRNPYHHFRLGLRAARAGDDGAAIGHLREAIRRRSDEPHFHLELADLLARTGRPERARESLETALALASGDALHDMRREIRRRIARLQG